MIIYFVDHKNVIKVDFMRNIKLKDLKKKIPFETKRLYSNSTPLWLYAHSPCPVSCSVLSYMGHLISIHGCVIGPPRGHASTWIVIVKPAFQ